MESCEKAEESDENPTGMQQNGPNAEIDNEEPNNILTNQEIDKSNIENNDNQDGNASQTYNELERNNSDQASCPGKCDENQEKNNEKNNSDTNGSPKVQNGSPNDVGADEERKNDVPAQDNLENGIEVADDENITENLTQNEYNENESENINEKECKNQTENHNQNQNENRNENQSKDDIKTRECKKTECKADQKDQSAIQNMKKRCLTSSVGRKQSTQTDNNQKTTFCHLPPAAATKPTSKPESSTDVTFTRSLKLPQLRQDDVLYYRDREHFEDVRKKKFESGLLDKYAVQSIHSPYRYNLPKLRKASIKATKGKLDEQAKAEREERLKSMHTYLKAAEDAIQHDDKLVKKDMFPYAHKSLRILIV